MQYQEKELFQGYEIKNWNFTPRLYKLFGAAAVFNILLLFTVVQANVFTTRGCDSPLVGSFCQVLDTIYLGGTLLDTNTDLVSKEYQKTVIEDADADVTFVDVSSATPPLTYPEGYFALANPESALAQMPEINGSFSMPPPTSFGGFPGIPNPTLNNGNTLLTKPQVIPTPNPKVLNGSIDDSPFTIEGMNTGKNSLPPVVSRNNNRPPPLKRPQFGNIKAPQSPSKSPMPPDDQKTADKKPDVNQPPLKSDAVAEVELNKKPFEDLGDFINDSLEKKEVDLTKPFLVVMDGVIKDDGKLDPKKTRFTKVEGDEKMREVARQAIEAVGDSGFLTYLKTSGVDKVNFTIVQDDKQINIILVSDQKTPERAKSSASLLNFTIGGLKYADEKNVKKLDENSKTLIENSKITSDGKIFTLNFTLPKQAAQELISATLKKRAATKAEKEQTGKPNSTATVNPNQKTSK